MTREEFVDAVNAKFDFNDGWYDREGFILTTTGKAYEVEWDESDEGLSNPRIEELSDDQTTTYGMPIEALEEIETHEPEEYFHAMAIMTSGSEEYVHIDEPGKWHDCVFLNLHDEGCYSLDTLDEDCDWLPDLNSPEERIQDVPFFQNPVAKTLQEFFDSLVEVPEDEYEENS